MAWETPGRTPGVGRAQTLTRGSHGRVEEDDPELVSDPSLCSAPEAVIYSEPRSLLTHASAERYHWVLGLKAPPSPDPGLTG